MISRIICLLKKLSILFLLLFTWKTGPQISFYCSDLLGKMRTSHEFPRVLFSLPSSIISTHHLLFFILFMSASISGSCFWLLVEHSARPTGKNPTLCCDLPHITVSCFLSHTTYRRSSRGYSSQSLFKAQSSVEMGGTGFSNSREQVVRNISLRKLR